MRRPRRIQLAVVVGAVALLLASDALASDPRLWVASGSLGGTYRSVYAQKLEVGLDGYLVLHRSTSGSGENLDLLAARRVDLAFAQADIYADRRERDPERYADLQVLGRLASECLYVAVRRNGPLQTVRDLDQFIDGRPVEVAVGSPRGGTAGSWKSLVRLRPELERVRVHPVGGLLALERLEKGTFEAVVWVTDPTNVDHHMLRRVLDSGSLELLEVGEGEVAEMLPKGTSIYRLESVQIEAGKKARRLRTLCTDAMLFGRSDTNSSLIRRARKILGLAEPGA